MRIIFMGTPEFAACCLERLLCDGHEVVLVLSQPDKPFGRKLIMTPPPVKQCALKHGIRVYQPETFKNNTVAASMLKDCNADLAVVVAYGKILPQRILDIPRLGCINVHASLLPKYRGAGPIQWAILNGETQTGVTTMLMDSGMDTGDMLLVKKVDIAADMNTPQLYDKLSAAGAELISQTLVKFEKNEILPLAQEHDKATYAPMLTRDLSPINWGDDATKIHNQIRGLFPWPSALTTLNGKKIKVHSAFVGEGIYDKKSAGTVVSVNPLTVVCGDGKSIVLTELQIDGGKRMDSKNFMRGRPIEIGTVLCK